MNVSARGFTLFFAVLVASLALAIGLAIYDITIRELDLSATATQSEYAIYAADTGAECALYWDAKYNTNQSAFATSSASRPPTSGIYCNSIDIAAAPWAWVGTASAATTTFTITFSPLPYCATVQVAKAGNPTATVITSHGYNVCGNTGTLQLERVLQVRD